MSYKHTPGPWWIFKNPTKEHTFDMLSGKHPVTRGRTNIAELRWQCHPAQARDNTNLIQYAPEIFEILDNLLIEIEGVPFRTIDCDQEKVDNLIDRGNELVTKIKEEKPVNIFVAGLMRKSKTKREQK